MNGSFVFSSSFRKISRKRDAVMPQGPQFPKLPETTADGARRGPSCRAEATAGARSGGTTLSFLSSKRGERCLAPFPSFIPVRIV
jgi:hypothetical protein